MTTRLPLKPCQRAHSLVCLASHSLQRCGSYNPWRNLVHYQEVEKRLRGLQHLHGVQSATETIAKNLRQNGITKVTVLPLYAPEPGPCISPAPRRTILHVGGLLEKKGIWLVVRMLRLLPKDVEIVFAGGGEEQSALEYHVRTRGLSDRIRVLGDPLPDQWNQLYSNATLVILPNLWNEPLGLNALRALAYGKAVVAFRGGGVTEWIEDGVNGITVPFGARTQFQQVVVDLLNEPERLRVMGKNAAEIWKARFHPDDHLTRLRRFYRDLLSENVTTTQLPIAKIPLK